MPYDSSADSRSLNLQSKFYLSFLFIAGIVCLYGSYFILSENDISDFMADFLPRYILQMMSACTLVKAVFFFCASLAIYKQTANSYQRLTLSSYILFLMQVCTFFVLIYFIYSLPYEFRPSLTLFQWIKIIANVIFELATPILIRKWIERTYYIKADR